MTNIFGPVPSRRLGRSLGVNNVPFKTCSYACAYCQLGPTEGCAIRRQAWIPTADIVAEVVARLAVLRGEGRPPDYLTLVSDGEPTLDASLGGTIRALRPLGIPVAVVTNGSLLWQEEVRAELALADWVSVKVDAVDERIWREINRPHGSLHLETVLEGLRAFAAAFRGTLTTESMMIRGVNDGADHVHRLAEVLAGIDPAVAYVAIPTRPPAEAWARPPDEPDLNEVVQVLAARLRRVEYLIGYEGNDFASTGDPEADLLAITCVHPMRDDAARELFRRAGADAGPAIARLRSDGQLVAAEWRGATFYVRRYPPA